MSAYAKSLVPLAAGIVLVVLGAVLEDETLRQLGYGVLGAAVLAFTVPNGPAVHHHEGEPVDDDGLTTLGNPADAEERF